MRIAFTHNLRLTDSEEEAEFDSADTVNGIAEGLRAGGHEVEKIEVTGPASRLAARIESYGPDLIFNTAEGRRGRAREAFYPALFEELGFPYTGSDAYVLMVTLDKWLTKLVLGGRQGIDTPRGRLLTPDDLRRIKDPGTLGLALPVIVKPNYEGSSKGIGDDAVVRDARTLAEMLPRALRAYPNGVLVEEFVAGTDVTVPFLEGRGDDGVLLPVDYVVDPGARSRFNIYDYRLKSADSSKVSVRCPPDLPRDVVSRLRAISKTAVRAIGMRDVGRIDFRLGEDGRIYLLEVNALPSLERGASLFGAAAREGLDHAETLAVIVESAARRQGLVIKPGARRRRPAEPLRIGFTFNVKRVDTKSGNDSEAEYDAPETIDAIRDALESYGHQVLPFEATAELPRQLMETKVDLVFNIAEGVEGRNREAAVPALCELLGIPYTGSDAATLSIALDKALSKRVLLQHGILTAEFQVMETGRERLSPKLKFPLIIKPNQEGSSKGVSASASVVDDDAALRAMVRELIERYRQPALIEVYIPGREFTVGLLGDRRPRVLPPMEILFKDKSNPRPVYDFQIKQEWEKHVSYQCPADLTPAELKAVERVARETFAALDCRDVSRVDLRMTPKGELYVIEVNPLPGLTPGYSDLCLIATAAGLEYRTLIGEILEGGLKRLREKRREARAAEGRASFATVASGNGSGNGNGNGNGAGNAIGGANGNTSGSANATVAAVSTDAKEPDKASGPPPPPVIVPSTE
ncbi:MAG: D-alanine-D-alanine ligase [Myxococcales bacterium]|jgi:D-alanine-D-alanine ligase|nr:D-alanine-D-alanine ligase [Myxococcales bacterium]